MSDLEPCTFFSCNKYLASGSLYSVLEYGHQDDDIQYTAMYECDNKMMNVRRDEQKD